MWLMGFSHHRQSLSYGNHFHMALEEIPPSPAESWFCQRKSQPARLFPCSHNYVIHLWLKSTGGKPLLVCDLTLWLREKVPARGHLLWCPYALIAALPCVFELELQPWQHAPAQFISYCLDVLAIFLFWIVCIEEWLTPFWSCTPPIHFRLVLIRTEYSWDPLALESLEAQIKPYLPVFDSEKSLQLLPPVNTS